MFLFHNRSWRRVIEGVLALLIGTGLISVPWVLLGAKAIGLLAIKLPVGYTLAAVALVTLKVLQTASDFDSDLREKRT